MDTAVRTSKVLWMEGGRTRIQAPDLGGSSVEQLLAHRGEERAWPEGE